MKNAAVVGAGVMGCLLALRLQKEGWQVTLFEAETSFNNCSFAAAGLLAPLSELDKAEQVIFSLGMESVDTLWKLILNQLTDPIYFRQEGSLVVHHPQDKAEWQQFSTRIVNKLSDSCYQLLTQDTLSQLEPELNQFKVGYYFPKEAQLDNQALLLALKKHLCQQGVIWREQTFVAHLHSGQQKSLMYLILFLTAEVLVQKALLLIYVDCEESLFGYMHLKFAYKDQYGSCIHDIIFILFLVLTPIILLAPVN